MECNSLKAIVFCIVKFDCERGTGWGLKGRNGMPGSCPQVYLHLLYLECKDIEHSQGYGELNLKYMGQTLKPRNFKYTLFAKGINCLLCILRDSLDN